MDDQVLNIGRPLTTRNGAEFPSLQDTKLFSGYRASTPRLDYFRIQNFLQGGLTVVFLRGGYLSGTWYVLSGDLVFTMTS